LRHWEGQTLLTICNLTDRPANFQVPEAFAKGTPELLLSNTSGMKLGETVALDAWSASIWAI
jgi:hypothetical protein